MTLNWHSSTSSKVRDDGANQKPISGFQGHPRSNVMVPIDSPGVVSYSTSKDPIEVSVIVLEIFDIKAIFL